MRRPSVGRRLSAGISAALALIPDPSPEREKGARAAVRAKKRLPGQWLWMPACAGMTTLAEARYSRRQDRVLSIVAEGKLWAISTHRREGDICDSGRPAAASTGKFRAKPRAQND